MRRMQSGIIISILSFYFICVFSVQGQSPADSVQHSTIVEADGYAYLSEDRTIRDIREEAIALAKREALERGETYIQSISKVENYQLQYDLVQSEAEGIVTVLENKDHGVTEDNRYHVWIRAEIKFRPKKPGSGVQIPEDQGPLFVRVSTDRDVYKAGEEIKIYLESNRDCYVRVLHVSVQGQVLQLLPNPHRRDNRCRGGQTLQIPGTDDAFKLEVVPPFGWEEIVVYASTEPLGDIPLSDTGAGLYVAGGGLENLGMKTRGLQIKPVENQTAQAAEFVEVRRSIRMEE